MCTTITGNKEKNKYINNKNAHLKSTNRIKCVSIIMTFSIFSDEYYILSKL